MDANEDVVEEKNILRKLNKRADVKRKHIFLKVGNKKRRRFINQTFCNYCCKTRFSRRFLLTSTVITRANLILLILVKIMSLLCFFFAI